jgi:hypothetical protein
MASAFRPDTFAAMADAMRPQSSAELGVSFTTRDIGEESL